MTEKRQEGLADPGRAGHGDPRPLPPSLAQVPWDDLRYLFGEIMYGGHITDDWDRRLCRTYLGEYIRAEMLEGEVLLAPGFQIPPNLDYKVRRAPSGAVADKTPTGRRRPAGSQAGRLIWQAARLPSREGL